MVKKKRKWTHGVDKGEERCRLGNNNNNTISVVVTNKNFGVEDFDVE